MQITIIIIIKKQKPRALGRKRACTKSATGQPLRFFATIDIHGT